MRSLPRNAAFLVFLAASLASPGRAAWAAGRQQSLPKNKAAAEPALEVSSPTLRASPPPANASELLDHFRYLDETLHSLSARFTQSVSMPEAGITQNVEGTVSYLKPDKLRLEHARPERQTVVCDGKNLWIYRRDRAQVIQSALEDWRKRDPTAGRLLDFGNYASLLKAYDVSLATDTMDVTLSPKQADQNFRLILHLSEPFWFPTRTELIVGSMRIKTEFEALRFNMPMDEKGFSFTPPADAEVLSDFKPPIPTRKTP